MPHTTLEREKKNKMETCEAAHVLIFPCPAQGHVNPMLKLAELLLLNNLHVTFLNIEQIHNRLIRFNDIEALSVCYPKLKFKTIPDFYSKEDTHEHLGIGERVVNAIESMILYAKPHLRNVLVSAGVPKISCIIADGLFGNLTTDLAAEFGILNIHFRTISACCFWAYLCVPKLFQSNELPITGEEDMDRIITNMPGMENLLRCRDLPSFYRENTNDHVAMDTIILKSKQALEADAIILNTFEDLEGPVLSQFRQHFPKIYTIGPLHYLLNTKNAATTTTTTTIKTSFNSSFLEVDENCMSWLDTQPQRSVIYVSFGSITSLKREELMEIWHGLVNSKQRFLWVIRSDMVLGKEDSHENKVQLELHEGTKERGFIVGWAPQEEVLAHKAIGGFLTHSGWNSTLEAVVAGVPMICWPYFADQQINSRFVSEVWKVGLDMKDVCDKNVVEKMVNDIMVHRKDEFLKSAQQMSQLAHKSVSPGGSSYTYLDELFQFIKSSMPKNH